MYRITVKVEASSEVVLIHLRLWLVLMLMLMLLVGWLLVHRRGRSGVVTESSIKVEVAIIGVVAEWLRLEA